MTPAVGGPIDWRRLEAQEAADVLAELTLWVGWLVERYSLDHRVVPPCWVRHDALLEVLTALWGDYVQCYVLGRTMSAPVEWQRNFRDLETRLREWAARTGCTPGVHRDDFRPIEPLSDA